MSKDLWDKLRKVCKKDDIQELQAIMDNRNFKIGGCSTFSPKIIEKEPYLKGSISPLAVAASSGGYKCFMKLLNAGASINWKLNDTTTITNYAVYGGNPYIVAKCADMRLDFKEAIFEALRKKHNDLFLWLFQNVMNGRPEKSKVGQTYLHVAAEANNAQAVYFLCNQLKMDVNSRNNLKETPLILACRAGAVDVVTALIQHGQLDLNAKDTKSKTALHYAAENDHSRCIQLLLMRPDIKPNITDDNNTNGSALTIACAKQNVACVITLLKSPLVDVNLSTGNGRTPLMTSILSYVKNDDTTVALIEDPRTNIALVDTNGFTVLHHAMKSKSTRAVEFIVNHPKFAPFLINCRNNTGATALLYGIDGNEKANVKLLIQFALNQQKLLDVNLDTYQRVTPLMAAIKKNATEIIELLLKTKMVDLNRQDLKGNTALHIAAECNSKTSIATLLSTPGMNPNIPNCKGQTAREMKPNLFAK